MSIRSNGFVYGLKPRPHRFYRLFRSFEVLGLLALIVSSIVATTGAAAVKTSLALQSSPNPATTDDSLGISGVLTAGGMAVSSQSVQVQYSKNNKQWVTIGSVTTASDGRFTLEWKPPTQGKFYLRAVFDGNKQYGRSTSNTILETVEAPTTSSIVTTTTSATTTSSIVTTTTANSSRTLVWSAGYESGDQSEWNWYPEQNPQGNAVLSVSSQIVHSGEYSGYYYYAGNPNGQVSIRAYPCEMIDPTNRPVKFYIQLWVYVPSVVNGAKVSIASWISFASLWFNLPPVNPYNGPDVNPITIDSFSNRQLALWLGPLKTSSGPNDQYYRYQTSPITWPFDKWFSIGIYGELHPGAASSKIIVYQDGNPIIQWTGDLGSYSTGLGQMHFGLYADPTQGTIAIYNDYVEAYSIP
jgi:hypothetical protein